MPPDMRLSTYRRSGPPLLADRDTRAHIYLRKPSFGTIPFRNQLVDSGLATVAIPRRFPASICSNITHLKLFSQ